MICCNCIPTVINYGSSAVYKDLPTPEQVAAGVVPLDSLPAAWWNAMWACNNVAFNCSRDYVGALISELNTVLQQAGVCACDVCTDQLYQAINIIRQRIGNTTIPGAVKSSTTCGQVSIDEQGVMTANGLGNASNLNTTSKVVVGAVNELKQTYDSCFTAIANAGYTTLGNTVGCALGTAAAGTATTAARSDHVHPYPTYVTCIRDGTNASCYSTMNYGASGISNPDWLAGWNGYELRAVCRTNLCVGYATSAGSADSASSATNSTCLGGRLPAQYFRACAGADLGPNAGLGYYATMTTSSGYDTCWHHLLNFAWNASNAADAWQAQLLIPTNCSASTLKHVAWRTHTACATSGCWNGWNELIDTTGGQTIKGTLAISDANFGPLTIVRDSATATANAGIRFKRQTTALGALSAGTVDGRFLRWNAAESTCYTILDTSAAITVAQGGTGATCAATARTNLGVPPTSHASTTTSYGIGTSANYGHVKLSNAYESSSSALADNGVGASQCAVYCAYEQARCLGNATGYVAFACAATAEAPAASCQITMGYARSYRWCSCTTNVCSYDRRTYSKFGTYQYQNSCSGYTFIETCSWQCRYTGTAGETTCSCKRFYFSSTGVFQADRLTSDNTVCIEIGHNNELNFYGAAAQVHAWINYRGGLECVKIGNGGGNGNLGKLYADEFIGNLTGTATCATYLGNRTSAQYFRACVGADIGANAGLGDYVTMTQQSGYDSCWTYLMNFSWGVGACDTWASQLLIPSRGACTNPDKAHMAWRTHQNAAGNTWNGWHELIDDRGGQTINGNLTIPTACGSFCGNVCGTASVALCACAAVGADSATNATNACCACCANYAVEADQSYCACCSCYAKNLYQCQVCFKTCFKSCQSIGGSCYAKCYDIYARAYADGYTGDYLICMPGVCCRGDIYWSSSYAPPVYLAHLTSASSWVCIGTTSFCTACSANCNCTDTQLMIRLNVF